MRRSKRALALILTAAMAVSAFPVNVLADTPVMLSDGTENEVVDLDVLSDAAGYSYTVLADGTVSVCGYTAPDGAMAQHIVIPTEIAGRTVTALSEEAFAYNDTVRTITVPATVTDIGNSALYHCGALDTVVFLGDEPNFGFTVAEGSHALRSVFVPAGADYSRFCAILVSDLGEDEAKNIIIRELGTSDTLVGVIDTAKDEAAGDSLEGGSMVTRPVIANGDCGDTLYWEIYKDGTLYIYGTGEMYNYDKWGYFPSWLDYAAEVNSIVIGEGVTWIGEAAFCGMYAAAALSLPSTLTYIGAFAFEGCEMLSGELCLPSSLEYIGDRAFYECSGFTGDLTIPDSVTTVGDSAFMLCTGFNGKLTLSNSLERINAHAFYYCHGFTGTIVIPDSVTNIGFAAFEEINGITSVTLGSSLSTLLNSFGYCENLTEMTFRGLTPPSGDPFESVDNIKTVYVPAESYGAYVSAFAEYLPEGVVIEPVGVVSEFTITDGMLTAYNGKGGEVVIPDSVTAIGETVFYGNNAITKLALPAGLTYVGMMAFADCTALREVVFTSLPDGDFGEGEDSGYTDGGDDVLSDDEGFGSIDGGDSAENGHSNGSLNIDVKAFYGCSSLEYVTFSDNLAGINASAFEGCESLKYINLPESLVFLDGYAFAGCTSLSGGISIPASVSYMGGYVFEDCDGITEITFNTLAVPDSYAVYGMAALETVYVPAAVYDDYCAAFAHTLFEGARIVPIGQSSDFIIVDGILTEYLGEGGEVTIPDGVTEIGASVFKNNTDITSIIMPDSVVIIGDYAFAGCKNLTSAVLSSELEQIGSNAFNGCGLKGKLTLPAGLTHIGGYAFYSCTGLIGALDIPASVVSVGEYAFSNCSMLNGALTVGGEGCVIGYAAFSWCTAFDSLTIRSGTVTIANYAFECCTGMEGDLLIPDSVTSLGEGAFQSCGFNGSLTLSENLEKIPYGAFSLCKYITGEVIIPDKVWHIGSNAFVACQNITSVVLGSGTRTVLRYAFSQCLSVETVTFTNTDTASTFPFDNFEPYYALNCVYVPEEAYSAYLSRFCNILPSGARLTVKEPSGDFLVSGTKLIAYLGDDTDVTVPEGITEIGMGAFLNNYTVERVALPDGVTTLGSYAFKGCTSLYAITLPSSIQTIGTYCFHYCLGMEEISLPESLMTVSDHAFDSCEALKRLTLPNSLNHIGAYAFAHCHGLSGDLYIPESVEYIGTYAFYDCEKLDGTLTVEGGDSTEIADHAFEDCEYISALVLGDGVSEIGQYAFRECYRIKGDLNLPDSLTGLGMYAFDNCGFSGTLKLSENLTSIPAYCFAGCDGFTGALIIPEAVTCIGNDAFNQCSGFTSVTFGHNLKSCSNPFAYCYGITEMIFTSENVPSGNPFSSVENLERVYVPAVSYDAYVAAYTKYVDADVEFISDILFTSVQNFAAEAVYSATAHLTWNAHLSDDVVGYKIRRDGEVIATVTDTFYTDRTLTAGNTYEYTVCGVTDDGTETAASTVTVSPMEPKVEEIVTSRLDNIVSVEDGTITGWVRDSLNLAPLGDMYTTASLYYFDGTEKKLIATATAPDIYSPNFVSYYTFNWDTAEVPDGVYTVIFELCDIDGAVSAMTSSITVLNRRPEQIMNLIAIGDVDSIRLTWAIAAEVDCTYRLYRSEGEGEFALLAEIGNRGTLSYTDTNVKKDTVYSYYVTAVNAVGRESVPSLIAKASLGKDTEPPQVTKLTPAGGAYLTGTTAVGVKSQDNLAVVKTELHCSVDGGTSWTLLNEGTSAEITVSLDTTAFSDGELHLKAIAYDAAGNVSTPMVCVYYVDNTGPEQVTGVSATATSVTVTLSWNDVADNDIGSFTVEKLSDNGEFEYLMTVNKTLGANILGLTPNTEYTYRVIGCDIHGNRGVPSEVVTVTTAADTTAPVVTRIRPTSGYYSDKIDLTFNVTDDHSIAAVEIQVSSNAKAWETVYTEEVNKVTASISVSHTLMLDTFAEGHIYVRAVATDMVGNVSLRDDTAPFVQHMIDRTAPAAPENVVATGFGGYIEVSWTQGDEQDMRHYYVYRSESEDGEFTLVSDGIASLNFFDRTAKLGVTYYYKVALDDVAGNLSEFSDTVSASVSPDTEAPVIVSIYPENGSVLGPAYSAVSTLVTDNSELLSVVIEYSLDGEFFMPLMSVSGINSYYYSMQGEIFAKMFSDGDPVYVRVTASDTSKNTAISEVYTYTYDMSAPAVGDVSSDFDAENGAVVLTWNGFDETDLAGYRVYRRTAGGDYKLIGQKQAANGTAEYSFTDVSIDKTAVTYTYMIEAVDSVGNTGTAETEISLPDRSMPTAVISCDSVMEVGVEYYIDASQSYDNSAIVSYHFDFGDGCESTERRAVHKYTEVGTYTVTLTVTDDNGNVSVTEKEVSVKERTLIGNVTIRVVDENGSVVPNAGVYFDLGSDAQVVKYTDRSGYASFTAEVGKHTVGCIIANNEWLPAKKEIVVTAGETTTVTMTMVHHVLVEGRFEIDRMTFDEIVAAGIDVAAPENQYYVRVTLYINYKGENVKYSFPYNPITGHHDAKPITLPDRIIYPHVIGGGWGGGGGIGGGGGGGYGFSEEVSVVMFEIPIDITCLKEFFDVKLHIMNNASEEFSMLDNVITLNVPEGLTVMDTFVSESEATVKIDEIKGQTTETIRWIIRGDEIGEYYLTADYSGILSQFNAPITTQFVAEDPIEVYGLSNLKLYCEIPDELDHATLYYNVSLINEGELDVYLPTVNTQDVLIEVELFDDRGTDILKKLGLTAKDVEDGDFVTSLDGDVGILKGGYAIRKHYMCIDQSSYSEIRYVLDEYWYEMENSYGLTVEIVVKPLSYFKSYLSAGVNAVEKAENLISSPENKSAYDYILSSSNFMYWKFYSTNGELLPSKLEGDLWNLLEGDFGEILFEANSDELIQAIIIDLMDISTDQNSEFSKYQKSIKWLDEIMDLLDTVKLGDILGEAYQAYGDTLPHVFDVIRMDYKWEFFESVTGFYGDSESFILYHWEQYVSLEYTHIEWNETDASKSLHKLYSSDTFKKVWEGIGFTLGVAEQIVTAYGETQVDLAIFINAQSNLENCYLLLDAIIDYVPSLTAEYMAAYKRTTNKYHYAPAGQQYLYSLDPFEYQSFLEDCVQVVKCAKDVKNTITEYDPVGRFLTNLFDNGVEFIVDELVGKGIDMALDAAGLATGGVLIAVKLALKLGVFIGNSVFNVAERHDIADNIRYISVITLALRDAVNISRLDYMAHRYSDSYASEHLQYVSYLLDLRQIGESQVALLGVSYEVLAGVFDSEELFYTVKELSGVSDVTTWFEWRDVVEDRLSLMRVKLFKNPVKTEITGVYAPTVTFDYASGETAQRFGEEYHYSINGGEWIDCDGGAIVIEPSAFPTELRVERADKSNTDEVGTGYCTVYGIPSLDSVGIVAVKTHLGYLIANLDNNLRYEVTFSETPIEYAYGEALDIEIPRGSYSYLLETGAEYEYIYVRSTAHSGGFASAVYTPEIIEFMREWNINDSKLTGKLGTMSLSEVQNYFERVSDSVIITDREGNVPEALATGFTLTVNGTEYTVIVPADVNGDGLIDSDDITLLLAYLNAKETLTEEFLDAAEVSGDGEVDIFDVFAAYDHINGAN